jgi:hypothetical protein
VAHWLWALQGVALKKKTVVCSGIGTHLRVYRLGQFLCKGTASELVAGGHGRRRAWWHTSQAACCVAQHHRARARSCGLNTTLHHQHRVVACAGIAGPQWP